MARLTAAGAVLGGLLWTAMILYTASQPEDRERGPGGPTAFVAVLLLMLIGFALGSIGLYLRQRQRAGRFGTATVVLAATGLVMTGLSRVAVDTGLAPAAVFAAGVILLVLSFVLFAISTLVSAVLPRGAAALLLVGTALLLLFNFGDTRIWLGLPFGLAWVWLGGALQSRPVPPEVKHAAAPRGTGIGIS